MKWYDYLSWISVAAVLAAYAAGSLWLFSLANAILFFPVALPSIARRAYSGAAINTAFGLLGWVYLIKH